MSTHEEWRPAPGFTADYEVSNLGDFRRNAPGSKRHQRQIKPFTRSDGYVLIGPYRDGKQITCYLHRLVCEAFHGPPPGADYEAAHEDGVPGNCRADNLRWATRPSNRADKRRHGTHLAGERHSGARLAAADVLRIFQLRADGWGQGAIGLEFGIHHSHVSAILQRKAWGDLDIPSDLISAARAAGKRCVRRAA